MNFKETNILLTKNWHSLFFFLFRPTSGKLPRLKICFPPYFGITRRCMQFLKKIHDSYFFMKKCWFFGVFSSFQGQPSVTAAWATPSPWSISLVFGIYPYFNPNISKLPEKRVTSPPRCGCFMCHLSQYSRDNPGGCDQTSRDQTQA